MTLSNAIWDHISGGSWEPGFYVFYCKKCKESWAAPATDPRIWPCNKDVSDARWYDPSMTCGKCGRVIYSGDKMWCGDPVALRRKAVRERAEANKVEWTADGMLPKKSYAVGPEGLFILHVRVRSYEVREPGGNVFKMTDYRLFDDRERQYGVIHVPTMVVRDDGVICFWTTDAELAARASSHYAEDMKWFKSPDDQDHLDEYERVP